ncbi:MAG: phosphoribosylamine--glycine ligase [Streptosporangiales bacterium]|nr:phosphoribosylamine--glycine ligase [Streptosporangiales bacterium]
MRLLVVGSGGREHALVRTFAADPDVSELHAAPGNPGIAELAYVHRVPAVDDVPAVVALAAHVAADLVVVGPEAPLVAGLADALRERGVACFGPSAAAATLEGSKAFAKDVMTAAGVPTAAAHTCETPAEVAKALDAFGPPYVVKQDGLAAGKGVVVTPDAAVAAAHAAAAGRVVVEEYLDGPEVSLFAITDGTTVVPLPPAQDFKRALDGDEGPNTGGMGAYSPLPWTPDSLVDDVVARVVQPTVDEMRRRGTPFAGLLYTGLALTANGPRVVEFNCRLGDPDGQVVLARLRSPLAPAVHAAAVGDLASADSLDWSSDAAVTVVVAARNYPGTPVSGTPIHGLAEAGAVPDAYVLHAGTRRDGESLVTAGGRVLDVVATGQTLADARRTAYDAVSRIRIEGSHHRKDIAEAAAGG